MLCSECGNTDGERFLGIMVRGVYDGVLVWQCLDCKHRFPRWDDGGKLSRLGREWIDKSDPF